MIDRRIGMLLLCAGGLGAYAAQRILVPIQVEYTRAAPPAAPTVDVRAGLSTAFLALPVDLDRVALRAEKAVTQRLAMGLDIADAACSRRSSAQDCSGPRLDGAVSLAGPVGAAVESGTVRVRVPMKVDAGLAGPAPKPPSPGGDRGSGEAPVQIVVSFNFKTRLNPGAGFEIARVEDGAADNAAIAVGNSRIARQLEARLKPAAMAAQEELLHVLAALPVGHATQRVWNALSQPIELSPGNWLKATPEAIGGGELVTAGGKTTVRIPIAARISIETERTAPAPKRVVVHASIPNDGTASIRLALPFRLDSLQQAVHKAFVADGMIETQPDRFGPPVKVSVHRARIYPSARHVALALDLTATRFEGQSFPGSAHLVGRPVLDASTGTMTLADVTFPPVNPRDAAVARTVPGAPRLATEPFASKLAAASRVDVSREIDGALPHAMSLMHQQIDEGLSLSARLDRSTPVAIEMSRSGAWLVSDVSGDLTFIYDGPAHSLLAGSATDRAPDSLAGSGSTRRVVSGDVAAAVVTAAALSAGGQNASLTTSAAAGTDQGAATQTPKPAPKVKRPATRPSSAKTAAKGEVAAAKRDWVPFVTN